MSNFTRNTVDRTLIAGVAGFGLRRMYDKFNQNLMIKDYENYGYVPKRKSLLLALFLTSTFGAIGMFYASPRLSIPFAVIDVPLMLLLMPTLLIRPFLILFTLVAVISHNATIDRLFPDHGGV